MILLGYLIAAAATVFYASRVLTQEFMQEYAKETYGVNLTSTQINLAVFFGLTLSGLFWPIVAVFELHERLEKKK